MASFRKFFSKNSEKSNGEAHEYSRSDYDNTFFLAKKVLRWVTIRMTHDISDFVSRCWDVFFWFEFVNLLVGVTLEFISMAQTAGGGSFEDAVKIFRMLPCSGYVLLALCKSFKMVHRRNVFENLVNEVGDMWPTGRVSKEEHRIIDKAQKELMFIVKGYYWCNNALLISFLGPPFLECLKRAFGFEGQMLLHFFYWLPFDPFQPGYVEIVLLIQTWHALVVIWSNLCGDLLFCAFLSHITTQFDLLSLRIEKLIYVPIDKQLIESYPLSAFSVEYVRNESMLAVLEDSEWEARLQREFAEIILRHRSLIRLSGDVEEMFSFALLVNFFNSSIIICFCGFCCVVVEKWNEIAYKSFLCTALSQTFLICWYGQKLLDSSTGVSHALYNGGWYRASQRIKKPMLIMLHRAQKGVHVTTFGFSVISITSYTKIIKTAWSYFTLLLNVYKQ